ncbi:MAG: hypothetical protein GKR77_00655 [Legionellales bacterium]|nr:hypothetical protein [Legionellales bacterium]
MLRILDSIFGDLPYHQKKCLESQQTLSKLNLKLKEYRDSFQQHSQKKVTDVVENMSQQISDDIKQQDNALKAIQTSIDQYLVQSGQLIKVIQAQIETEPAKSSTKPSWFDRFTTTPLEKLQAEEIEWQQKINAIHAAFKESADPQSPAGFTQETLKEEKSSKEETNKQSLSLVEKRALLEKNLATLKTSIQQSNRAIDPSEMSKTFEQLPTSAQITELEKLYQRLETLKRELSNELAPISNKLMPEAKDSVSQTTPPPSWIDTINETLQLQMATLIDQTQLEQPQVKSLITDTTRLCENIKNIKTFLAKVNVSQFEPLADHTRQMAKIFETLSQASLTDVGPKIQNIPEDPTFAALIIPSSTQNYGEYSLAAHADSQASSQPDLQTFHRAREDLKNTLEKGQQNASEHYQNCYDSLVQTITKIISENPKKVNLTAVSDRVNELKSRQRLVLKLTSELTTSPSSAIDDQPRQKPIPESPARTSRKVVTLDREAENSKLLKTNLSIMQTALTNQYKEFPNLATQPPLSDAESKTTEELFQSSLEQLVSNYRSILTAYNQLATDALQLTKQQLLKSLKQLSAVKISENLLDPQLSSFQQDFLSFKQAYESAIAEKQQILQTLISANQQLASQLSNHPYYSRYGGLKQNIDQARTKADEEQKLTEDVVALQTQIKEQKELSTDLKTYQGTLADIQSQAEELSKKLRDDASSASEDEEVIKPLKQNRSVQAQFEQQNPCSPTDDKQEVSTKDEVSEILNQLLVALENTADDSITEAIQINDLKQKITSTLKKPTEIPGEDFIRWQTTLAVLEVKKNLEDISNTDDVSDLKNSQVTETNQLITQGINVLKEKLEQNPHPDSNAKGQTTINQIIAAFTNQQDDSLPSTPTVAESVIKKTVYTLIKQRALYNVAKAVLDQSEQIALSRQRAIGVNLKYLVTSGWEKLINFIDTLVKSITRAPTEQHQTSAHRRNSIYAHVQKTAAATLAVSRDPLADKLFSDEPQSSPVAGA